MNLHFPGKHYATELCPGPQGNFLNSNTLKHEYCDENRTSHYEFLNNYANMMTLTTATKLRIFKTWK